MLRAACTKFIKAVHHAQVLEIYTHPRPSFSSQRPRSFWSTPGIATSGKAQLRRSAIPELPVTLRMLRVKSDKSENMKNSAHAQKIELSQRWRFFFGADQKERRFWGECLDRTKFRHSLCSRDLFTRELQ